MKTPQGTQFDAGSIAGLSESEAAKRLQEDGYNELPSTKRRSFFAIAYEVVREPMFLLLIGGGIIYLMLGDVREAAMLLGFVFVVMGITLYQERKDRKGAGGPARPFKPQGIGRPRRRSKENRRP